MMEGNNWFLIVAAGLCCTVFLCAGGIALYLLYNNPFARMNRAFIHRIENPRQRIVVHKTIHQAPVPESVQLRKWQMIQVWTGLISIVAVIVGAVLLNVGDIAVILIAAIANAIIAWLKYESTKRFGSSGGDEIAKR